MSRDWREGSLPLRFVLAAALLLVAPTAEAEQWRAGQALFGPGGHSVAGALTLMGPAQLRADPAAPELRLPDPAYATWVPGSAPSSSHGTVLLWADPLWPADDQGSHALLSFGWSGPGHSYFALSQGWWEPEGSRRLYLIVSNQEFAFCLTPWKYHYTYWLPGQTTMIAATWQAGARGFVRLYVDGQRICERPYASDLARRAAGALYIGSDRGATDQRQRFADFKLRQLVVSDQVLTDAGIHTQYLQRGGDGRSKWIEALVDTAGMAGAAGSANTAGALAGATERRMMFDEDTGWAASREEIERRIARLKASGFNVYAPCVWDGGQARFRTSQAPMAAVVQGGVAGGYDPLQYLLASAHRAGIRVYPWFVVARRVSDAFPAEYFDGAPPGAFNVQDEAFRDFIVAMIGDVMHRYAVDGVNLDYIRSIGICSSAACARRYREKYGRSLADDWRDAAAGQEMESIELWNRAPVTEIVTRVARMAREASAPIVVSVDTVARDRDRRLQGVDELSWVRSGFVDLVVHMAYDDPVDLDTVDYLSHALPAGNVAVAFRNYDQYGPEVVARPAPLVADYVRLSRKLWPGAAIAFYHFPHLSDAQVGALRSSVFATAESGSATQQP